MAKRSASRPHPGEAPGDGAPAGQPDLRDAPYVMKDDATIPIMAWIGPSEGLIRPEVMGALAEAGFTVSLSKATPGREREALDIAHAAGVRLLLMLDGFDLGRMSYADGRGYRLKPAQRERIRKAVEAVKDHPGLYGYHIHDEPAHADLDWIAAVIGEIRRLDPYHVCYVNHNAPVIQGGYGAGTQEALWKDYVRKVRPRFLSYDHYPVEQKPRALIRSWGPEPFNVFPGGIAVKPNYFACLEFARMFCTVLEVPLWAFTCSVPHWSYPVPTEGHIRFQLMCDLAYGARGLQYFTYVGEAALCRHDGTTTPTWEIARRVNRDVHALWKKMRGLRSIGVHHTGPLWPGTTPPMLTPVETWGLDHLGPKFACVGDPAVLGLFDDAEGGMYVLAVNRNPVESASISLDPSLHDAVPHKWTPLLPGEGKLFKLRTGEPPVML